VRRYLLVLGALLLALSLTACGAGSPAGAEAAPEEAAVGEPVNGFPSWEERVLHVYVNRARAAPADELAGCSGCGEKACYKPTHPLEWRESLARSARFHAANLTSARCGMLHDSPCPLVSGIAAAYPSSCDGAVSCACVGGAAACKGTSNTGIWARFDAFGNTDGWRAENVAGHPSDPVTTFYQWLYESSAGTSCDWSTAIGHRFSILNPQLTHIGNGADGSYSVQDFWGGTTVTAQRIPAGAHTPKLGPSVQLRASWYAGAAPKAAMVNVGGACQPMALERGTGANGTYLRAASVGTACVDYYFWFEDASGAMVTYPTTGAFGIGCAYDWTATRPAGTAGCTAGGSSSGGGSSSSSSGGGTGSSSSSSSGGSGGGNGSASGGCAAGSMDAPGPALLAGLLMLAVLAARRRKLG
jgi:MYXO-CTERM domain-containing protein